MSSDLDRVTALAQTVADDMEPWRRAELYLLGLTARERLRRLGVDARDEMLAALVVLAQLLAPGLEEWGGDARDVLGDVVVLGLELLQPET